MNEWLRRVGVFLSLMVLLFSAWGHTLSAQEPVASPADRQIQSLHKPRPFDLKQVEGTWKPVKGQLAGFDLPDSQLESIKLVIRGGSFQTRGANFEESGKLVAGATSADDPQPIDVQIESGPNAGSTVSGIIRMEGSFMVVCYATVGERPGKFESTTENQTLLLKYERQRE